ncbi:MULTISPECIES: SHOCT-like domain-containing protein [unclassified Lysinibacillus]|uniref:SHOCT-like domain-containing protein n=1 Tax=unclassified Lysinibacillus TaxID=2636778 RepID=UPI00382442F0
MKEEISRVLTMIQEGKLDAEKGSELIQALKDKEDTGNNLLEKTTKYLDKTLKVRVVSSENDNVMVNLPIKLVKVVLMAGHSIAASIPQSEKYVKDIDINLIIEAIENELDGQIVDIKSANGDTVSVIIE